jgi:PAS domain S-box-containing protein
MPVPDPSSPEAAILIFAPSGNDAANAAGILASVRLSPVICGSMEELCQKADEETGALLLTEETLGALSLNCLLEFLKHQPPWSDIPAVLVTSGGENSLRSHNLLNAFGPSANVTLLERPLRAITLISSLQVALRARRRQYQVRDLLESYSLAMDGAQMGSWDLDWRNQTSRRSLRHDQIFGYGTAQKNWGMEEFQKHVLERDRPMVEAAFKKAFKGDGLFFECRIQWPDHSIHWIAVRGRVHFNDHGEPLRLAGVVSDITERKAMETVARIQRERLDLVLESTEVGLWYWDLPEDKLHWNAKSKEHYGLPPDAEVSVSAFFERLHPEDRERTQTAISKALKDGSTYDIDYRTTPPGERWLRAVGRVFFDGAGKPVRFDGITIDATERKREEELLHQAQEQLQQTANDLERRVKERTAKLEETVSEMEAFSYSVSHDLRAPLRAMQGYSQTLLDQYAGTLDEQGREFLVKISRAAERLDRLTQDLLTYSRVVRSPITMAPVDMERLVRDILQQYPLVQQANAEITIQSPLLNVVGHEASLIQCISNLLGNAVKFVLPGVTPRIKIWSEPAGDKARLFVQDKGIGIPPDQLDRIFKMFERVNKQFEGTGIGLAIVRKAMERMGGRVGVESALGKGSTFWLELPVVKI